MVAAIDVVRWELSLVLNEWQVRDGGKAILLALCRRSRMAAISPGRVR